MATTSIWAVKNRLNDLLHYAENPEKTECPDLKQVLRYAGDDCKTEHRYFTTGVNCMAETACQQMMNTKRRFGKLGGNVAFHGYQSFKPGEVTPAQAHEIGIELAKRMWGDRYEVLVATHLNTNCCHNHFVVNSVSFEDGIKLVVHKGTHLDLWRVSDEICLAHGLSVIKNPKGKTPRCIYFAEKRGEPTKYNLMRDALDRAIGMTYEPKDLVGLLNLYGYEIRTPKNRKYATICAVGGGKPTRLYRLGADYTPERIQQRILQNDRSVQLEQPKYRKISVASQKMRCKGNLHHRSRATGFQALYLHYLYLLGAMPKGRHPPLSPILREELRRLDHYVAQHRFLVHEGLHTAPEVTDYAAQKSAVLAEQNGERERIYNRLRRCTVPEEVDVLNATRDALTAEMATLRKQIKLAEAVLKSTPQMRVNIREEQRLQTQMRAEIGRVQRGKERRRELPSHERER